MNFSLEIGPKTELDNLPALKDVYITMLPGGDYKDTSEQAAKLAKNGFNPIPHFPARSIENDEQLKEYKQLAAELSLDVLVEIHDEDELERILPLDFSLIGINNRNLTTFEVDLETTKHLSSRLEGKIVVSESGIKNREDIDQILSYDVLNFLVGESFMRANNPGLELNKLFSLL